MMVSYSPQSARALAYLKRPYNDIEIFVEDKSGRIMWNEFLRNVIPDNLKFTSVNLLGGREAVIDACRKDQETDGRRRLYIIDGDFDHLLGKNKPNLRYLYRLRAYCIENILSNRTSCVDFCNKCSPKFSEDRAESELDWHRLMNDILPVFRKIFTVYATAQKFCLGNKTSSVSVMRFVRVHKTHVQFNDTEIKKHLKEIIISGVKSVGVHKWRTARLEIGRRADRLEIGRCASGKTFVLPIVRAQLMKKCGYHGTIDQLKVFLACEASPSVEPYLYRRLRNMS